MVTSQMLVVGFLVTLVTLCCYHERLLPEGTPVFLCSLPRCDLIPSGPFFIGVLAGAQGSLIQAMPPAALTALCVVVGPRRQRACRGPTSLLFIHVFHLAVPAQGATLREGPCTTPRPLCAPVQQAVELRMPRGRVGMGVCTLCCSCCLALGLLQAPDAWAVVVSLGTKHNNLGVTQVVVCDSGVCVSSLLCDSGPCDVFGIQAMPSVTAPVVRTGGNLLHPPPSSSCAGSGCVEECMHPCACVVPEGWLIMCRAHHCNVWSVPCCITTVVLYWCLTSPLPDLPMPGARGQHYFQMPPC
jgi:hypothetical protein